nr:MAG TPA: hypothetical protein [Caudoviricetes sp.]
MFLLPRNMHSPLRLAKSAIQSLRRTQVIAPWGLA